MVYQIVPIEVLPGVEPQADETNNTTRHYVSSSKIRFQHGLPEKIGGWTAFDFDNNDTIEGCTRLIFSYILAGNNWNLIGTHQNLYSLLANELTNITPVKSSTTAIANSLDTYYKTLGNDPISTVDTSTTVTIADTATKVRVGDTVTISGVPGAVNGIPAIELNTSHFVRTQDTNSFTVSVATAATSTGSGGGASVVLATGILTVNQTSHGFREGIRVKLAGAVATGGITAGEINVEHIIRNVQTNTYDILTTGTATSSVTGGGGAGTTVQEQIDDGLCDATQGAGYGLGLYGVGLYGVSKSATTGSDLPRRWVADRFGDLVVTTPGNQGGVYSWDSDTTAAPALVSNAPTAVNYLFTSNEILVTFGASDVGNRLQWCDQGNLTTWSATSTNQAGQDDIEGAGDFISHAPIRGSNLLFTQNQVYTFRYIGLPFVWETRLLDQNVGIIAQNARISHNGIVYWMGQENFYWYKGGKVEIIPSNSKRETTLKDFIFDNLNFAQKSKVYAWLNQEFNEIWWHYPSAGSDECDSVVRFNYLELTWTPDTFNRTAGEYPSALTQFPRLADSNGIYYQHENGNDDNGVELAWSLVTNWQDTGTDTGDFGGFIPDSIQTGTVSVTVDAKKYPQSTETNTSGVKSVLSTTEKVTDFSINGRFVRYSLSGTGLGQEWRSGRWKQLVKGSTRR